MSSLKFKNVMKYLPRKARAKKEVWHWQLYFFKNHVEINCPLCGENVYWGDKVRGAVPQWPVPPARCPNYNCREKLDPGVCA